MTRPARSNLLALLALIALIAGCGRPAAPDAAAPAAADGPRIVVLSPAIAAILCDLGLRERIVGRHAFDMVLDNSVPICGEQRTIHYEALLRARPTHVLTELGAQTPPSRLGDLAGSNGWVLRDFRVLTLGEIDRAAGELESMFDADPAGTRVERLRVLVGSTPSGVRWQGRVLLLMGSSPIYALGPGCAHHELLVRVGGVPAITEGSPSMQLHAEDVTRLAPDAIILLQPAPAGGTGDPPTTPDLESRLGVVATLDIPAVRAGRIALIDHPLSLLPSSALADVAEEMSRLLEMWAGH